jgi:hypothetical protein
MKLVPVMWNIPVCVRRNIHSLRLMHYAQNIFNSVGTFMPITVVSRSKTGTVFARSNAGIVISNTTQGINICVLLFCACVVLCR